MKRRRCLIRSELLENFRDPIPSVCAHNEFFGSMNVERIWLRGSRLLDRSTRLSGLHHETIVAKAVGLTTVLCALRGTARRRQDGDGRRRGGYDPGAGA